MVVNECHAFTKVNAPRLGNIYTETFYQVDFLPFRVQTDRIFRSFHFADLSNLGCFKKTTTLLNLLDRFQNDYTCPNETIPCGFSKFWQILHYPVGGGFFDWHVHTRYPVNYGLILNLSERNIDFSDVGTQFMVNNELFDVSENVSIGDLTLFRFDLEHRVSPCDPNKDITFSTNGRWIAALPIFLPTNN
jgi:hypothetical protein